MGRPGNETAQVDEIGLWFLLDRGTKDRHAMVVASSVTRLARFLFKAPNLCGKKHQSGHFGVHKW